MEIFHVFTKEAGLSKLKVSVKGGHNPKDYEYDEFVIGAKDGQIGSDLCSKEGIDDAFSIRRNGVSTLEPRNKAFQGTC